MNLRDAFGSLEVATFVQDRMRPFDVRRLREFKLYAIRGGRYYAGRCSYPSRAYRQKDYRIVAGANPSLPYPTTLDVITGSRTLPPEQWETVHWVDGRITQVTRWEYVSEPFTFRDPEEILVLVAGHEAFHYLRRTRQVPGRNGNPAADRFGLEWVRLFREGRRTNEGVTSTPIPEG